MSQTDSPNETNATRIFDAETLRRALRRIAHEIIERNRDLSGLVLAGIPNRGIELSERIAAEIEAGTGIPVLDSVAVTLWHCLKLAGSPLLAPRWGRLLGD